MKNLIRKYKKEIFLIWIIIGILSGFLTGKVCQLADPEYFTSTYEKKNLLEIIGYGITSNPKIFLMLFVSGGIGATYFYLSSKGIDEPTYQPMNIGTEISKNSQIEGSSGLMSEEQIRTLFEVGNPKKLKGVLLGTNENGKEWYSFHPKDPYDMNWHCAVCGGTGTGKTVSCTLPMLLQNIQNGISTVVTDPKEEVYGLTSNIAREHNMEVRVINTVHPDHSDGINFVALVNGSIFRAKLMVRVIIDNIGAEPGFWGNNNESLLESLILIADHNDLGYERSMDGVIELLGLPSPKLASIITNLPLGHPAKESGMIFATSRLELQDNIKNGLAAKLGIFSDKRIRSIVSRDDVDLTLPGKKPCVYYICTSAQTNTLNVITGMVFSFLFYYLAESASQNESRSLEIPVNMIMEEFPNIMMIPDFNSKMQTLRSYNIFITMIFQDLERFRSKYEDCESIISACSVFVFLGSNHPETLKYVETRGGMITVEEEKETISEVNGKEQQRTITTLTKRRPLYWADEWGRMNELGPRICAIFVSGQKPFFLKKCYWKNHPLAKHSKQTSALDYIPVSLKEEWKEKSQDPDRIESYAQDSSETWFPMGEEQPQQESQNEVTKEILNNTENTERSVIKQSDSREEPSSKQKSNQVRPKKIEESKEPFDENDEAELTEMDADLISF